ncbi:MAG: glycosyltransferase family 9 protein [Microscillaceae bacterium]|nr:glycosyltransferase family 9 protein [Microscillaceae bacterium]
MPNKTYHKILIIQTAFLGDVILATALIEKLYQHFPTAQLDFLLRKGNEGLLQGHPKLRQILIWDKKQRKLPHLWQIIRRVRAERYDLLVNLHRFASSGLITAFSRAGYTVGFRKNPWSFAFHHRVRHLFGDGTHEVSRNLSLISHLTDAALVKPRLYPQPADTARVETLKKKPYFCLAPTSVWFTKQWPAEKWIALCDLLPASHPVYLLGAPDDVSQCQAIQGRTQHPDVQVLAGQLSLLASAALMADARMNFVNDSAPLHLASAVNAPTTAIFCSTLPSFGFGPLADEHRVIEARPSPHCRPCGSHGHQACPRQHFKCAFDIAPEQA